MKNFIPKVTKRNLFFLLTITALYFLLTTWNLTKLPIFVDEAIYSRWSQIALNDPSWRFISLTDGKQPLFTWLAMPMLKIFKDPLFATRFVSVISGYFTVLGLCYAGWLIKDKKTAYLAALFGVITPFLFFYNRFAVVAGLLTAFGIWIFSLSIVLVRTLRLDVAMILGITTGLALLVKSPAQIYLPLIPATYIYVLHKRKIFSKPTLKFIALVVITWIIAIAIYNVQRLSPWMSIISQKNSDFVVPYSQMFSDPIMSLKNLRDSFLWLFQYMTIPLALTSFLAMIAMARKAMRPFLTLSIWLWLPIIAQSLIARLYRPRYIVFIVPYLLIFLAYFLSDFKKRNLRVSLILLLIIPSFYLHKAIFTPSQFPFIKADLDYIHGWASGYGVKEISQFLLDTSSSSNKSVIVGTEGTFGLLPHGLELYTEGRNNLDIIGYWPLNEIPPQALIEKLSDDTEVYFILNNTQDEVDSPSLELISKYKKVNESWIRLYRVK